MTIHKTIFGEVLKNTAVIIFSMSVLMFMEKFVRLTRLFMGKGADFLDVLKIFIYLQPSILLLSAPMALLIAVFLTYGRMSSDNEIVVLKGSGMSFRGISKAPAALSLIFFAVLLFVSLYVLPLSMNAFKYTLHETIVKKASMTFEEESFSDVFRGTTIYVKDIPSQDEFRGIFVYRDADKSIEQPAVIVAESGTISSNPEEGLIKLSMNNGLVHSFKESSSSEITFSKYDFLLTSGIDSMTKIKPEEIKTASLWNGYKDRVDFAIELNRRLVLPFACLIFGILGPALSNKIGKIGRLGGFSLSLTILILYYMILIMGEGLSKSGEISPFLGGWAANIIFSIIAAMFYYIAYKDTPGKKI